VTLDCIIGQDVPVSILKRGLAAGTLGHAYLFSGRAGLGKETTARAAAEILQKQGGPYSEIHVLSGEGSLGVDEIRSLRKKAAYASAGNVIWLIIGAERMTVEAANAFLKTLEEPHQGVYFFLTTENVQRLLPTIVSRCQHLPFRAVPEKEIAKWLAGRSGEEADSPKIKAIARLAQGSLGRAWDYYQGPLLAYREEIVEKMARLPFASYPEVLGMSQTWPEEREKVQFDLQVMLEWYRDLLTIKGEAGPTLYNPNRREELKRISSYYPYHSLYGIIDQISAAKTAVAGNARIRFSLGYLLLLMKKGALT